MAAVHSGHLTSVDTFSENAFSLASILILANEWSEVSKEGNTSAEHLFSENVNKGLRRFA